MVSDEEFPASATCLFASNEANSLPVAGLVDTAEYTAKKDHRVGYGEIVVDGNEEVLIAGYTYQSVRTGLC